MGRTTVGLSVCPVPLGVRAPLWWPKARLGIAFPQHNGHPQAAAAFPSAWPSSSSPPPPGARQPRQGHGAWGWGGDAAHSWVSSRVSGLQGPSLLLQLLLRLWPSLATWASGSERIRYLRGTAWLRHWDPPPPPRWQEGVGQTLKWSLAHPQGRDT